MLYRGNFYENIFFELRNGLHLYMVWIIIVICRNKLLQINTSGCIGSKVNIDYNEETSKNWFLLRIQNGNAIVNCLYHHDCDILISRLRGIWANWGISPCCSNIKIGLLVLNIVKAIYGAKGNVPTMFQNCYMTLNFDHMTLFNAIGWWKKWYRTCSFSSPYPKG